MREDISEMSEEEDSNGSEMEDQVPELVMDDNDRSPTIRRSPAMRRAETMNVLNHGNN